MFDLKPDYGETKERIDAFWECELIDRPVVQFTQPKPLDQQVPLPVSDHATPADRWLDAEFQTESHVARLSNQEFLGDTLPIAYPNLGPEVFSALYGCPMHFGDYGTSWSDPILHDWARADEIRLDLQSPYLKKLLEMTDLLLQAGKNKFIVGMTDWHPGGDWLAALRDPQNLAIDMIAHLDDVRRMLTMAEADYFLIYDMFYNELRAAGQPITTWMRLLSDERFYVPSNDFSCMISSEMFDDVFLPGIINECRFYTHSIYHLDGPNALRHLDSLLSIPELNAIQWVPGAGNLGFSRWIGVYQRVQAAGKGIQVSCTYDDIAQVMETLDPHGLYLSVSDVPSREAGLNMLRRLENWCASGS